MVAMIDRRKPVAAASLRTASVALDDALTELVREQAAQEPGLDYLAEHGNPRAIANHVRTFEWYAPHLQGRRTILDWGCCHAPDSCLIRARFGRDVKLHGCDLHAPARFARSYARTGLHYRQASDPVSLPYANGSFDAVVGSGALEHSAMDYESLKELHRILKPGGVLIITYLPNRWSIKEWYRRNMRGSHFHRRLYSVSGARELFLRAGFYPQAAEYHTFCWHRIAERLGCASAGERLARAMRLLAPVHLFSGTLCIIAERVASM